MHLSHPADVFYYPAALQLGFDSEVKPRLVRDLDASRAQVLCMLYYPRTRLYPC